MADADAVDTVGVREERLEALGVRREATGEARALGYSNAIETHAFVRLNEDTATEDGAALAAEVPVALVYNGRPHVVMMCTPADLEDFAYGFTISEGIGTVSDIRRVDEVRYSRGIELQIEITSERAESLAQRGRALTGRTGCGLCGVEVIDEALRETHPVRSSLTITRDALWVASGSLGAQQPLNNETNAIHAAAWATSDGRLQIVREDVGRHNALDKVIGALSRGRRDMSSGFVIVTSRASYELVQKAAAADIPVLAAVSRPTALAVQLAEEAGITLIGLLRGKSANVYSHGERVT